MRRTSILAGALATMATTLGAAPGALAANAVFGGSTSSGQAIVINADKAAKKLRSAVIAWRAECGDGMGLPVASSLTPAGAGFTPRPEDLLVKRNGRGRFSGTQLFGMDLGDDAAAVKVTVSGRLGAKSASGTLSAEATIFDKPTGDAKTTCKTGRLRWKASRAPGRVYGGKTSQDEPFVAKVDARRKRVTDVLVGWGGECKPDGFFYIPDQLQNFSLTKTGRFGDTWTENFNLDDGGKRVFGYAVSGRLSRRSGAGAMRVTVTESDAGGATTATCDSGPMTWKAKTG
jgi:hypothetical protein